MRKRPTGPAARSATGLVLRYFGWSLAAPTVLLLLSYGLYHLLA